MRAGAQAVLFAARERGQAPAVAAYRGTPYGADLARVAAHVKTHGAFPRLVEE